MSRKFEIFWLLIWAKWHELSFRNARYLPFWRAFLISTCLPLERLVVKFMILNALFCCGTSNQATGFRNIRQHAWHMKSFIYNMMKQNKKFCTFLNALFIFQCFPWFQWKHWHNFDFSNADKGFEVFINDHFVFDHNDGQFKTTVKVKVSLWLCTLCIGWLCKPGYVIMKYKRLKGR